LGDWLAVIVRPTLSEFADAIGALANCGEDFRGAHIQLDGRILNHRADTAKLSRRLFSKAIKAEVQAARCGDVNAAHPKTE
jgi:hypothetical protein